MFYSREETENVDNEELISTGQDSLADDEDNEPAREVQHDKGSAIPLSTPKRTEKSERKEKPTTTVRKSEPADAKYLSDENNNSSCG
ncbi:hypothetical protein FQR65_LT02096 [Abscondita terminalis]|nr:hypothetical protein FQR65_LT02096 [Abscondita terminalis]